MIDASPQPWDAIADAFAALEDADRHGDEFDRALARAEFDAAADRLGLVAAAILHAAVGGFGGGDTPAAGYVLPRTWLRLSEFLGVSLCFDMARAAEKRAKFAERAANRLLAELDAMRRRLAELETRIDDATPGIGEPRLRVV